MNNKEIPEFPTFIEDPSEYVLAVWERTWRGNNHLIADRDYNTVWLFCEVFERFMLIKSLLKMAKNATKKTKMGLLVHENANGTMQTHPLIMQEEKARIEMLGYLKELGLTPASFAKLEIGDASKDKLLENILSSVDRAAIVGGK